MRYYQNSFMPSADLDHLMVHDSGTLSNMASSRLGDLAVWDCGTYCELDLIDSAEYADMDDDYTILRRGSPEWQDFATINALI